MTATGQPDTFRDDLESACPVCSRDVRVSGCQITEWLSTKRRDVGRYNMPLKAICNSPNQVSGGYEEALGAVQQIHKVAEATLADSIVRALWTYDQMLMGGGITSTEQERESLRLRLLKAIAGVVLKEAT